jgi:hypothetical protein
MIQVPIFHNLSTWNQKLDKLLSEFLFRLPQQERKVRDSPAGKSLIFTAILKGQLSNP